VDRPLSGGAWAERRGGGEGTSQGKANRPGASAKAVSTPGLAVGFVDRSVASDLDVRRFRFDFAANLNCRQNHHRGSLWVDFPTIRDNIGGGAARHLQFVM